MTPAQARGKSWCPGSSPREDAHRGDKAYPEGDGRGLGQDLALFRGFGEQDLALRGFGLEAGRVVTLSLTHDIQQVGRSAAQSCRPRSPRGRFGHFVVGTSLGLCAYGVGLWRLALRRPQAFRWGGRGGEMPSPAQARALGVGDPRPPHRGRPAGRSCPDALSPRIPTPRAWRMRASPREIGKCGLPLRSWRIPGNFIAVPRGLL